MGPDFNSRNPAADGNATASPQKAIVHHAHARSIPNNTWLSLTPAPHIGWREAQTVPATPLPTEDVVSPRVGSAAPSRRGVERSAVAPSSRAHSVDRALFTKEDKRAEPRVALSTAQAPGYTQIPDYAQTQSPRRQTDLMRGVEGHPGSSFEAQPSPASCALAGAYWHIYDASEPNQSSRHMAAARDRDLESRPVTPLRQRDDFSAACPPQQRNHSLSAPESFTRPYKHIVRRRIRESGDQETRNHRSLDTVTGFHPASIPCPPSPSNSALGVNSRGSRDSVVSSQYEDGMPIFVLSGTPSAGVVTTPLTSPSEAGSIHATSDLPIKDGSEAISACQSDPSLPALLSGASSVSADPEGEFLGVPGVPSESSVLDALDTSDSLTPPAVLKEPISGFPLRLLGDDAQQIDLVEALAVPTADDNVSKPSTRRLSRHSYQNRSDDDCLGRNASDSDSDEGLTMAKHNRKPSRQAGAAGSSSERNGASHTHFAPAVRRRNTSMSIASIETIKRASVGSDETTVCL